MAVDMYVVSLFAKIKMTTVYPGRGEYTLWDETKGLMPFATRSNPNNPNEWFFSPVFHTGSKLATIPRKALRLIKFDVTCGKKLNDVYYFKDKASSERRWNTDKVSLGSHPMWIHSFPSGYIGANGRVVSGFYSSYIYDTRAYTSPAWYRDFCGNYYTGSTAASGCFMKHVYSANQFYGGPTGTIGKNCFGWGEEESGCILNACIIPKVEETTTTGFSGNLPKPYGFLIGLKNQKIWPKSAISGIFGVLFGVPKANTIHTMAMYIKCGTKYDLYPLDQKCIPQFPYKNDRSHVWRLSYEFSAADGNLRGMSANPNKCRLISVDNNYKYFVMKGMTRFTSANCAIFTPPTIAYSGNSTGGIYAPATILDSWISFHK